MNIVNEPTRGAWNVKPWSRHGFDPSTTYCEAVPPIPPPHIAMAQSLMTPSTLKQRQDPKNFPEDVCKPWNRSTELPRKAGDRALGGAHSLSNSPAPPMFEPIGSPLRPGRVSTDGDMLTTGSSFRRTRFSANFGATSMTNQSNITCKVTSDWTELPSHRYSTGEINVGGSKLTRLREVPGGEGTRSTLGSFTTPIIVYRPEEHMSADLRRLRQRIRRKADDNYQNKALFSSFGATATPAYPPFK